METRTRIAPKNNRNTEKFFFEVDHIRIEELQDKKFSDIGTFRCHPCTTNHSQQFEFKQEKIDS
jgi:hypothetical protein